MLETPPALYLIAPSLSWIQDDQPPAPGEAPADTGITGAPGATGTGAPSGKPPSSLFGDQFFIILVVLVGAMLLFSVLGQRRDRKKREAMISAVKKHDRVQTVGGVIGSVVDLKPDHVVLKVDESSNTRITFSRSAIQQVLTSAPETGATREETTAT